MGPTDQQCVEVKAAVIHGQLHYVPTIGLQHVRALHCLGASVRRDACCSSVALPLVACAAARPWHWKEAATTASDKDHHTSRPLLRALAYFPYSNRCINQ